MPHYHYLIAGGGMTADAAIRGIREADSDVSIGLAGAETERPYNRSPLSKGLWKGKAMDSIWRGTDATDAALGTSAPEIYAAGDVARCFYNSDLDKYLRVEHEDNANTMGRAAGRAMAGASDPYHHLPFFYSDLFDLGYEAVDELDPSLELIADWQEEPYRKGVAYYLREGRVRGVLLWNLWE